MGSRIAELLARLGIRKINIWDMDTVEDKNVANQIYTHKHIGMNKTDINSCIRMSFSGNETKDNLNYLCQKLKKDIETLRQFNK